MLRWDFPPVDQGCRLVLFVCVMLVVSPSAVRAAPARHDVGALNTRVTIVFGQEMGNIRPFRVTISPNGAVKLTGPVRTTGTPVGMTRDAISGLVLLAQAEGFRSLPSFTSCPGALPDIATRYIGITTPGWRHRASARGGCLTSLNQLFAVLMATTHAAF